MKFNLKLIIGLSIIIFGIIFWHYGLFYRYNYLTARIDIFREKPKIITSILKYGSKNPRVLRKKLEVQYGYESLNIGLFAEGPEKKGIEMYNAEIEKYLNKRNGKDWHEQYEAEMDSLFNLNTWRE